MKTPKNTISPNSNGISIPINAATKYPTKIDINNPVGTSQLNLPLSIKYIAPTTIAITEYPPIIPVFANKIDPTPSKPGATISEFDQTADPVANTDGKNNKIANLPITIGFTIFFSTEPKHNCPNNTLIIEANPAI